MGKGGGEVKRKWDREDRAWRVNDKDRQLNNNEKVKRTKKSNTGGKKAM